MDEITRLRKMRADLIFKARNILDSAESESRDLTAEEDGQFQTMHDEADKLRVKIEEMERAAAQKRADRQMSAEGDLERLTNHGISSSLAIGPSMPGNGLGSPLVSNDHINRAIVAWCRKQYGMPLDESDLYACEIYRQHVDRKFTPESRGLTIRLSNSQRWRTMQARFQQTHRTMHSQNSLSTDSGSSSDIIPEGFVYRLEQAMLAFGGMLQVSELLITDSGNDMPWPTANDTNNKGVILGESVTGSPQSIGNSVDPVFSAVLFQAWKYSSKLVQVSAEILEDSAFDLPSILGAMLGERLGRILNEHCTTGDGDSKPRGIAVAASVGEETDSATAIESDELIDLEHSVDPAYRSNARWMMHDKVVAAIRKLKDEYDQYLWQPGIQQGVPDRLLGYPVVINQDMPDTLEAGAKPVLFGDLSKYKIRLAGQVRNRRLVERYADTDQEGFVSFIRADGDLLDAGTGPVKALHMGAVGS